MKKTTIQLPAMQLVGITARTNNLSEMDPSTAKIGATVAQYFQGGLSEKIAYRKKPGTTYSVYTEYESDLTGDYTYFIGEAVEMLDNVPEGFVKLDIAAQDYVKFTNGPGSMPEVCLNAWQDIWQMNTEELGGDRRYHADFELYDERAQDPDNVELDIYIGIQK